MSLKDKFVDISYNNRAEEQNYISLFDIDNNTIDFEGLSNYDDSLNVLNANNLNTIVNTTDGMQGIIKDEVDDALKDKAGLFQSWINNLSQHAFEWQNGSQNKYYKNDVVTYSEDVGAIFLCIQDCDGTISLPNNVLNINDYWLRIYLRGDSGLNVYNLNYIGEFDWEWQGFIVNDVVYVDNYSAINFYICINGISYSSQNSPENDVAHWLKLFSVHKDEIMIYDSMPNQAFFDDVNSPSVFGVLQKMDILNDHIFGYYGNAIASQHITYYDSGGEPTTITPQSTYLDKAIYILSEAQTVIDLTDAISMSGDILSIYVRYGENVSDVVQFDAQYGNPRTYVYTNTSGYRLDIIYDGDVQLTINVRNGSNSDIVSYAYFEKVNGLKAIQILPNTYLINIRNVLYVCYTNNNDEIINLVCDKYSYNISSLSRIVATVNSIRFIDRLNSISAENPCYLDIRQNINYVFYNDNSIADEVRSVVLNNNLPNNEGRYIKSWTL